MQKISLYPPSSLPWLSLDMQQMHWRQAARLAEADLADFLGIEFKDRDVLLVDRATRAIELAARFLRQACGYRDVLIPDRTWRGVQSAVELAGLEVDFDDTLGAGTGEVAVPTTFGGVAPDLTLLKQPGVIYDCAHTAYPRMLAKDVSWNPESFVVLSFYPTKPLGAFGGGALIGCTGSIDLIRRLAWGEAQHGSRWYYPQTAQSCAISSRINDWSQEHWAVLHARMETVWRFVKTTFHTDAVWPGPQNAVRSPHLLVYKHSQRLAEACEKANLETGDHYPSLVGDPRKHLSIPFWHEDVVKRLQEVL